jgi:hypothetical protein
MRLPVMVVVDDARGSEAPLAGDPHDVGFVGCGLEPVFPVVFGPVLLAVVKTAGTDAGGAFGGFRYG